MPPHAHVRLVPPGLLADALSTDVLRLPDDLRRRAERFFGEDLATVRVHIHPHLARLGCRAAASADRIYFAPGAYCPSSSAGAKTCFHELTHCVQQRRGLVGNPLGGGTILLHDSALEAEAEQMSTLAETCVVGPLADGPTSDKALPIHAEVLQPVVEVVRAMVFGSKTYGNSTEFEELWRDVSNSGILDATDNALTEGCRSKLKHWVTDGQLGLQVEQATGLNWRGQRLIPGMQKQAKVFTDFADVARALRGHYELHDLHFLKYGNEALEDQLAKLVSGSDTILASVRAFVRGAFKTYHDTNVASNVPQLKRIGRYAFFYSKLFGTRTLEEGAQYVMGEAGLIPANLLEIAAFLADYGHEIISPATFDWDTFFTGQARDARMPRNTGGGASNANENSPWVQAARTDRVPIGIGPSWTTELMLRVVDQASHPAPADKMLLIYVALALFAFWNIKKPYLRRLTEIHFFHEVRRPLAERGIQVVSSLAARSFVAAAAGDLPTANEFEYPNPNDIPG